MQFTFFTFFSDKSLSFLTVIAITLRISPFPSDISLKLYFLLYFFVMYIPQKKIRKNTLLKNSTYAEPQLFYSVKLVDLQYMANIINIIKSILTKNYNRDPLYTLFPVPDLFIFVSNPINPFHMTSRSFRSASKACTVTSPSIVDLSRFPSLFYTWQKYVRWCTTTCHFHLHTF